MKFKFEVQLAQIWYESECEVDRDEWTETHTVTAESSLVAKARLATRMERVYGSSTGEHELVITIDGVRW